MKCREKCLFLVFSCLFLIQLVYFIACGYRPSWIWDFPATWHASWDGSSNWPVEGASQSKLHMIQAFLQQIKKGSVALGQVCCGYSLLKLEDIRCYWNHSLTCETEVHFYYVSHVIYKLQAIGEHLNYAWKKLRSERSNVMIWIQYYVSHVFLSSHSFCRSFIIFWMKISSILRNFVGIKWYFL